MKKNKITEHPSGKGYVVTPNIDEVNRVKNLINETFINADITYADALTALCLSAIEIAYSSKISKPQFLMQITNWWEELDGVHDKK